MKKSAYFSPHATSAYLSQVPVSKLNKKEIEEQIKLCDYFNWFEKAYCASSWQPDVLHTLATSTEARRVFAERKDALEQALTLKEHIVAKIRSSTDRESDGPKPYRKRGAMVEDVPCYKHKERRLLSSEELLAKIGSPPPLLVPADICKKGVYTQDLTEEPVTDGENFTQSPKTVISLL